jgi:hypothetical protein
VFFCLKTFWAVYSREVHESCKEGGETEGADVKTLLHPWIELASSSAGASVASPVSDFVEVRCLFVCLLLCVLVSVFVCLFLCLFASVFVCFCVCLFVCLFVCSCVSVILCLIVYLLVCSCRVFVCVLVCSCVRVFACVLVCLLCGLADWWLVFVCLFVAAVSIFPLSVMAVLFLQATRLGLETHFGSGTALADCHWLGY